MNAKEFEALLITLRACREARQWAHGKSLKQVWAECERADWLLWLCGRMCGCAGWPTREQIVLVACEFAETVLPIYEKKHPKDDRPRKAIEAARTWANCPAESKNKKAKAAAAAAAAAADAADAAAAAYADGGADAAAAADAATDAAAAADTTAAAAAADTAAIFSDTRQKTLRKFADVVRKRLAIPE